MHWPSTTSRYLPLVVDTFVSAVIAYVLSAAAWGAIGAMRQGAVFVLMFAPALLTLLKGLIVAPFVVATIYGLAKGRYGFVLGPILLAAAVYTCSSRSKRTWSLPR